MPRRVPMVRSERPSKHMVKMLMPQMGCSSRSASLVILMPICSSPMGNCGCGSAVIHSRKSSCRSSVLVKKLSTSVRYESPRCVFCNSTHSPSCVAVEMSFRAMISWP